MDEITEKNTKENEETAPVDEITERNTKENAETGPVEQDSGTQPRRKSAKQVAFDVLKSISPKRQRTGDPSKEEVKSAPSKSARESLIEGMKSLSPKRLESFEDIKEETPQRRKKGKGRKFTQTLLAATKDFLQSQMSEPSEKTDETQSTTSVETVTKANRVFIVHTLKDSEDMKTLNLYEAFGSTAKRAFFFQIPPLLVIEVIENGMTKRYLVPHKHSLEGRWLLYGRYVYVYMGHAFVEHRPSPNILACFVCINNHFKMPKDYYQCLDCQLTCPRLNESTVTKFCKESKITTQEMQFPYDPIKHKKHVTNY